MKEKKNNRKYFYDICFWVGFVLFAVGFITFRTNIGKVLGGVGFLLLSPKFLEDIKNYENLDPFERVQIIGLVIFVPFVVFGFIYLQFFR